jgi:hypothetical protein
MDAGECSRSSAAITINHPAVRRKNPATFTCPFFLWYSRLDPGRQAVSPHAGAAHLAPLYATLANVIGPIEIFNKL